MNLGLFNCFVDLKWTYSLQGGFTTLWSSTFKYSFDCYLEWVGWSTTQWSKLFVSNAWCLHLWFVNIKCLLHTDQSAISLIRLGMDNLVFNYLPQVPNSYVVDRKPYLPEEFHWWCPCPKHVQSIWYIYLVLQSFQLIFNSQLVRSALILLPIWRGWED